jgi:glycosyltransferase involved in cell wall biosynthesis
MRSKHLSDMARICLTVTNVLNYDQRMQRIASTLQQAGYDVVLIGRNRKGAPPLLDQPFDQVRLPCRLEQGPLFYLEYNLRLFFWLIRRPFDAVGLVDADTLLGGGLAAILRRKKRIFDAHEFYTQVPELINRPLVRWLWGVIERVMIPTCHQAYTVGPALAALFSDRFGLPFAVVRNLPLAQAPPEKSNNARIILYQGALNADRGLEIMLEALLYLPDYQLWLAGEGDLSSSLRNLTDRYNLGGQVRFLGLVNPASLPEVTRQAWLGINLLHPTGASYYYSLANKFFDYVQAGIPQITMDFPEYRACIQSYPVALLLPELTTNALVEAITRLEKRPGAYQAMESACTAARQVWIWEHEAEHLTRIWTETVPLKASL